jgi:predicted  nucleic acid-binding Zn-ribbon protein
LKVDPIEAELLKAARDLMVTSQTRLRDTVAEMAELEEQLTQLQAQRDGQLDAGMRLQTYRPRSGTGVYLCPNCWIGLGQQVPLALIRFGSEDVMRCPSCGRDFGISPRPSLSFTPISR